MNRMNYRQLPPFKSIRKVALFSCTALALLLLAGCTLGQAAATPAPFNATPYAAEATASDEQTEESVTADLNGEDSEAEGSEPEDSEAEGRADADSANTSAPATNEQSTTTTAVATTGTPNRGSGSSSTLRYNGEIAAASQVVIVAETAGMVLSLNLEVGDRVTEGEQIAQLDTTLLEAQKAQALAGLDAAQAQLDLLQVAADPDDVAAAEAAVAAAAATYQRALAGATAEDQRLALAQLKQAEAAVTVAQAGYNQVKGNPAIGALPQSLQLQQATIGLEAAQAQYDKVLKGTTDDVIAGAYAQLAQARAALRRLEEGAKTEQVRAVEAQVRQAEMAVYLAQLQISKASVEAPVDGIVARVNSVQGAMASPGTPLVTLLSQEVEITIDVEEARLSQLAVGQPATIRVDAYPEQSFAGEVAIIAPELNAATRTVQVTIRPTEEANVLAPGMFATVEVELVN